MDNYRPICITSVLGKVVESVVRNQFKDHLENLLPNNMYGFRKSRSTQDAIVDLTDRILELKASGKKVAILALDAKAAFDCLSHDFLLSSMKLLGIGPLMLNWTRNFISNCKIYVDINGSHSDSCVPEIGVGQGRRLSPDYFNIGSISASFWSFLSESFLYADDGCNVIAGDSIEECNEKIQKVACELSQWYDMAGLTLSTAKSELIGFGFDPNPITVNGATILPSNSIKFLGIHIESNLKWNKHVELLCNKLRSTAGRIRSEGRLFSINDRRTLYFAWSQGSLMSNALAFLPRLNHNQLKNIQTAANSAVRAILGLPRVGHFPISHLREQLKIPSVTDIRDRLLCVAAWKKFSANSGSLDRNGPLTRSKSDGKFIHPVQKGFRAHMIDTKIVAAWNDLPKSVKEERRQAQALKLIKDHVYKF